MFPPVRKALIESLNLVLNENQYSNLVLEKQSKLNKKFGARDRRQLAEALYDIVRSWRLWSYGGRSVEDVVDAYVNKSLGVGLAKADLPPAVRLSVNDELWSQMSEELGGAGAEAFLEAMDRTADVFIRPNLLKTNMAQLESLLGKAGFDVKRQTEPTECLKLNQRKNLFTSELYKKGFFEVQDSGSQALVSRLLKVVPGLRVIDACAGAGGKTLQLAACLKNKGKLIAMDINPLKLKELRKRARRAGAEVVEVREISSSKTVKRLQASADVLLLDVPCSGTGVLKRKPDTKLKFSQGALHEVQKEQAKILDSYSRMLRPGGQLLYATCSILPSENENQVRAFIDRNPGQWELKKELHISPLEFNSDGFYGALLVKS